MKEQELINQILACRDKSTEVILSLNNISPSTDLKNHLNEIIKVQEDCLNLIKSSDSLVLDKTLANALEKSFNRITVEKNIVYNLLKPSVNQKETVKEVSSGFFLTEIVKKQEVDAWITHQKTIEAAKNNVSVNGGSFDLLIYVFIFIGLIGLSRLIRTKLLKKDVSNEK